METRKSSLNKEETRFSGKSLSPTFLWHCTDCIESDASSNCLLPRERLYRIIPSNYREDTQTDPQKRVQHFFYCCAYPLGGNLPRSGRRDTHSIDTQTNGWGFMKYAVIRAQVPYVTSFIEIAKLRPSSVNFLYIIQFRPLHVTALGPSSEGQFSQHESKRFAMKCHIYRFLI
jgi:hypothetical protein